MSVFEYRNNALFAENLPVDQIAKAVGTPCYLYSRKALETAWQAFDHAFGQHPHLVCYAVKANSNLAVLNVLAKLGAGFDIVSQGELERALRAGGDPKDAIAWYRRSADKGFALAQFKLGQLYQFGQLVGQDSGAARDWYGKAADQGLADAQYNLAVMLETGDGGEVDAQRALTLYRGAADGGIPEAFLNLAGLLAQGELVDQDLVEALKWLILADRAGLDQGESMSAAVRQLLSPAEITDAESRADRWQAAHGERSRDIGTPQ